MTTASNTDVTRFGRDSVDVTNDSMLSPPYPSSVLETTLTGQEDSVVEVPLAPIVVESEVLDPHPTLGQLMQRFCTALGQPPVIIVGERRLAGGGWKSPLVSAGSVRHPGREIYSPVSLATLHSRRDALCSDGTGHIA
jgi:hypothetical protein